ncbi:hypothetical protein ACO1O0_002095 [Amphichorda felina]
MAGIINAILRGTALLWTLLITALIGNVMANNVNAASSATKAINWTMFVAAWSWVAALYGLGAAFITALAVPIILLPLDFFAMLFTFIDAIVLASMLKGVDCSHVENEGHSWIGYGSHNNGKRCREIQASTAFMWFLWVTFCGCLFFSVKGWRGGGSIRTSRPSMTQVGV